VKPALQIARLEDSAERGVSDESLRTGGTQEKRKGFLWGQHGLRCYRNLHGNRVSRCKYAALVRSRNKIRVRLGEGEWCQK